MNAETRYSPVANISPKEVSVRQRGERYESDSGAAAGPGEFAKYVAVIVDHLALIMGMGLVAGAAGVVYALGAKPLYEANMTIMVEETGPNAPKNILSEASSLFETKKAAVAEMELLRSRAVIAPVVDKLGLAIDVQRRVFPVIGAAIANAREGSLSRPSLLRHGGYAWGGEKAEVSVFKAEGPLQHRSFVITATGPGGYTLSDEDHSFRLNGRVGVALHGAIGPHRLELLVDRIDAGAGVQFYLRSGSRLGVIAALQQALQIAEQGKQSGLVEVRLQGDDPVQVQRILDATAREYLQQSVTRRRNDAARSLAFVDAQLLPLRAQLTQADARHSQFRHEHATLNLADQARVSVEQAAAARARRAELQQKRTELLTHYGDRHPAVVGINGQLRAMDLAARADQAAIRALPALEQDEVQLRRESAAKTELYNALSITAQQLRVLAASQTSRARLVDAPVLPEQPIKSRRTLIVSAAVMLGLFLGIATALLKRALGPGGDDVDAIAKLLGSHIVRISIPHSDAQQRLIKQRPRGARQLPLLALLRPEDPAVEALREFRAAMQFSLPQRRNNIVMLTAPTAGIGKSFIAANCAALLAASGKQVLLIDADLRSGHLHRYFTDDTDVGLCEVLGNLLALESVMHRKVIGNLDFIPAGSWPASPSECLLEPNFGALLDSVSEHYDLVIVNAPQVLATAAALSIGERAGAVFLLARCGKTRADEVNESLKRLGQAGIAPVGVVFNDVRTRRGAPRYRHSAKPAPRPAW